MPEYFVIFHGILLGGGVVTTLNPLYGAEELQHTLGLTTPSVLFTTDALFPGAKAAISHVKLDLQIVIIDSRETWSNVKAEELTKPAKTFSEMLSPGASFVE